MKHAHPFKMIVGKTSSVLLTFFFLCQQTWFFKCILQGFIFEAAIFVSRSQMGWCGETEFQGEGVGYACRSKKRLNRQVIKFPNLWKDKNSLQIFKKKQKYPLSFKWTMQWSIVLPIGYSSYSPGILIWWWLRTVKASMASVLLSNSSRPDRVFELAAQIEQKSQRKKQERWQKVLQRRMVNSRLASKTLNLMKDGTLCSEQSCRDLMDKTVPFFLFTCTFLTG